MRRSVRALQEPVSQRNGWVASAAVDDLRFDKLYRYDELMAALDTLAARATRSRDPRVHRALARGPRDPARDRDQRAHRPARREARGLGRRQHPLDRGHRLDRRAAPAEPARHRPRQRPTMSTSRITRAVDTRTFYVVPRVNPDGVELALATPPTYLRSSVRHVAAHRRARRTRRRRHRRRRPHPHDARRRRRTARGRPRPKTRG